MALPQILCQLHDHAKQYDNDGACHNKRNGGSKLVIFSASDTSSVEILLKRLEIYECFEGIYTVYDVGIGKSDKESYKKVARSAGMDISDTWVYEDILRGVRAAHNAGLKVCAVYDKDSADDWDEICSIADKCIITG